MKRTFIYSDEKSGKFWTIEINGNSFTVNYGKTGTNGQAQTKDFADEAACKKAAEKLIAEKTKKGYIEQSADVSAEVSGAKQPVTGLPSIIRGCSVDFERNGRSAGFMAVIVNWDPYDEVEDPGGVLIRGDRMYYKVMPSAELAIIDGLRIIADKLASTNNKFSSCDILVDGKKVEVSEEQTREWIKIATDNGKIKKAFYSPEKPGDVKKYVNAIKAGDLEQVKKFVENGANIKRIKQTKNDVYSLEIALEAKQPELIRYFCENLETYGMNGDDYSYFTSIVTDKYNEEIEQQARLLLENGYDFKKDPALASTYVSMLLPDDLLQMVFNALDLSNDDGKVLTKALSYNDQKGERLKRILQLIEKGANARDTTEHDKRTAQHNAVLKYGTELELIKLLVEKGADPDAQDHWEKTPLEVAIKSARPTWDEKVSPEVYEYLYSITTTYKPNIFEIIRSESLKGKLKTIKLLLSKNVDFNVKNENGDTPLQYAKERQASKELIAFIEKNTKLPEIKEETRLHFAFDTMKSDELFDAIKSALEDGTDPNVLNENGDTFLHRLMENGDDFWKYGNDFLDLAFKNGANPDIQNNKGQTPLMLAVNQRNKSFVEKLIEGGADVNLQDNDGNTALHLAKQHLLPVLLAKPDLMLANKEEVTAIDHLRKKGYYYTDDFVHSDKQTIKKAIDALGLNLPTDQELKGVSWDPKPIEADKPLPENFTEVSSYYFPFNDASDAVIHLGGNRLGIIGGYPRNIQIFDTVKGKVLWGLNSAAEKGYAIYDAEKDVIYIARDGHSAANYITAHKPDSGDLVWKKECKLTNSSQQFGTLFVQNATHVIHANIRKSVLYMVNKQTGKLDGKVNMEHSIHCGANFTDKEEMFTRDNFLYVIGYNWDKDFFTVDQYDIATQSFVATLFSAESGVALLKFIEGDNCVYLLADSGVMYKLSLPDGKVLAKTVHDTAEPPYGYRIKQFEKKDGKLKYVLSHNKEENKQLEIEYDLKTDKASPLKDGFAKLPDTSKLSYGKKKWMTIKQVVIGNALFEVQKKEYSMESRNSYLHRLT